MQNDHTEDRKTATRLGRARAGRRSLPGWLAGRVGFLTRDRRKADALALIVLMLPATAVPAGPAASWHAIDDIAATAERFLADRIGRADGRLTVRAAALDSRLQLAKCSEPLDASLQSGAKMRRRMTVRVSCAGDKAWKLYVTVDVVVSDAVVTVARTLPGGHVLTRGDLALADRDVSALTRGYVTRPAEAIGRRLKQQVVGGSVLTPNMMRADIMIRRGQSVTITVRNDALNISMEGKALMDGAINQRIRVENLASRRIVEGIVRSPEHVEVLVF